MPPEALTADAVYRFCESRGAETRALGMRLIGMNPRLAIPEELHFRKAFYSIRARSGRTSPPIRRSGSRNMNSRERGLAGR